MRSLLLLAVFSFQLSVPSLEVSGTVKDPSGAVLPGATIEATVAGLSVATAVTGPDGRRQAWLEGRAGLALCQVLHTIK